MNSTPAKACKRESPLQRLNMVPSHRTHSFVVHHHVVATGGLAGIVQILLENGAFNHIGQTTIAATVLRKSLPPTYYFPIPNRGVAWLQIAGPTRESSG